MKEDVVVSKGDVITFTTAEDVLGTASRVYMNYKEFPKDVNPGERILLDDGKLIFEVTKTDKNTEVEAVVVQGGPLKSKKGVNLPNTKVSLPALTPKDIKDALFAIENKVDWIALSFVRTPKDLEELQDLIAKHSDHKIPIIAKIEKPEAVENIDKIVAFCDALMVARGDLGVEVPAEEVPLIQKKLIHRAKTARIPVIVATQMLESMIDAPRPTRAEINDIANSVLDGADAVMLSAETASGKYPIESVTSMAQTIRQVEGTEAAKNAKETKLYFKNHAAVNDNPGPTVINDNVVMSACRLARDTQAKAIIGVTRSGYTAFRLSHHRPEADLYVFTPNRQLMCILSLYWGVKTVYYDREDLSTDDLIEDIKQVLIEKGALHIGDIFVNTLSMPLSKHRRTNAVKLSVVD